MQRLLNAALAVIVCAVQVSATAALTVQVNVSGRGIPVKDLAVWVMPEVGDGWRVDAPMASFSLPLLAQQRYLIHFMARNCIPEEVLVDARIPAGMVDPAPYFPLNVLLERGTVDPFTYALPTMWIRYRPELEALGHVDANAEEMPPELPARMTRLLKATDVATRTVTMDLPRTAAPTQRARGRMWLNELMEPCGRDDATYQLERGGTEHGYYVGYVRSLQGELRATGHYADADLRVPHGDFTFYHRGGAVESVGRYAHGMKTGLWRRFARDGSALAERVYDPRPLAELLLASREVDSFGGEQHLRNRSDAANQQATWVHRVVHEGAVVASGTSTMEERPSTSMRRQGADRLLVERLRVSVVDVVEEDGRTVEYRRVTTFYGAVYHFRDGRPCSEATYGKAVPY